MTIKISSRCTACGNCVITCPPKALVRAPGHPRVLDQRCNDCMECIEVCPVDAITMVQHGSEVLV